MMIVGCGFFFCYAAYGSFGRIGTHLRLYHERRSKLILRVYRHCGVERRIVYRAWARGAQAGSRLSGNQKI
jgi:hypothetical protein